MRQETKIEDSAGNLHSYSCAPLPFDRAFDLGLKLAGIVGGPVGAAFKGLMLGSQLSDQDLDKQVLAQAIGEIGDLPDRIIARGGSDLIAEILTGVIRVGEDEKGKVKQDLGDPADRTAAFGAGNLGEAIRAVKWVLTVNYGPFLMELWEALQPQLAGLAISQDLVDPESLTAETTTESNGPTSSDLKPTEKVSSIS